MFPFNDQILSLNGKKSWTVATFDIDPRSEVFTRAKTQAELKSQYTIAASQSGEKRPLELKYQRQLMGCLAEIGVQSYLNTILKEFHLEESWKILRYDDIRTDEFKSASGEWDLRICKIEDNSFKSVECRSSILHNRSLIEGLNTCNIIGPYTSIAKSNESYKDIYFLPLFEYLDFRSNHYDAYQFEALLAKKRVIMHLVGGCLRDVIKTSGISRSLGQGATRYQTIQILNGLDAKGLPLAIRKILQ